MFYFNFFLFILQEIKYFLFILFKPVVNGVNESQSSQEDDDDNDEKSGINIEKAKELLKKQDKKDKELYRQRIKQLHTVNLL